MKRFLAQLSIPISGLMLGIAALGNLLGQTRVVCSILVGLFWICFVLKAVFLPGEVKKAIQNPALTGICCTFTATTMLLAVYVKPLLKNVAIVLWVMGIVLHLALMLWFTIKFVSQCRLSQIYPSTFIVYVGIAMISITAPAFGLEGSIGTWAFWLGFTALFPTFAAVAIRYFCLPIAAPLLQPQVAIFAAPVSLCLVGYLRSVSDKRICFVVGLLIASHALYIMVLCKLPGLFHQSFHPGFASLTFPLVITAIATKQAMACLCHFGIQILGAELIVAIETIIACLCLLYVFGGCVIGIIKSILSGNHGPHGPSST